MQFGGSKPGLARRDRGSGTSKGLAFRQARLRML